MIRYETLLLTVPEITADETSSLESSFDQILHNHKATLISFERWGKYRLAFPVRSNDYGVYFLIRFEMSENVQSVLDDLRALMKVKLNELVMRSMTCRLQTDAPLAYHRPESLEEVPTRDVETMFKEGGPSSGMIGQRREHPAGPSMRPLSAHEQAGETSDSATEKATDDNDSEMKE